MSRDKEVAYLRTKYGFLKEACKRITRQDRTRGYPTPNEWKEIVHQTKRSLKFAGETKIEKEKSL